MDSTDDEATGGSIIQSPARAGEGDGQSDQRIVPTREIILAADDRRRVVLVDVPELGRVEMCDVNVLTSRQVRETTRESSTPARTYAENLALHVIVEPSLTAERIAELPPETWAVLAAGLADATEIAQWYEALSDEVDPQMRLYRADQERWLQWARELKVSMQPTLDSFATAIAGTHTTIGAVAAFAASNSLASIVSVARNLQSSGVLAMITRISTEMARVSAPAADLALLHSGINSPLIHTPTYIAPRISRPRPLAPSPEEAERARMVDAYDVLVRLEQALRHVITRPLEAHAGPQWWKQRVPQAIRATCELNQAKAGGEGKPLIEYAYVDDYRAVILRSDNWREIYEPIFQSKAKVEACFEWCSTARVEIGHARPLPNDLWTSFAFAARWLIAAIQDRGGG